MYWTPKIKDLWNSPRFFAGTWIKSYQSKRWPPSGGKSVWVWPEIGISPFRGLFLKSSETDHDLCKWCLLCAWVKLLRSISDTDRNSFMAPAQKSSFQNLWKRPLCPYWMYLKTQSRCHTNLYCFLIWSCCISNYMYKRLLYGTFMEFL